MPPKLEDILSSAIVSISTFGSRGADSGEFFVTIITPEPNHRALTEHINNIAGIKKPITALESEFFDNTSGLHTEIGSDQVVDERQHSAYYDAKINFTTTTIDEDQASNTNDFTHLLDRPRTKLFSTSVVIASPDAMTILDQFPGATKFTVGRLNLEHEGIPPVTVSNEGQTVLNHANAVKGLIESVGQRQI